jgi:hypothetical protein
VVAEHAHAPETVTVDTDQPFGVTSRVSVRRNASPPPRA